MTRDLLLNLNSRDADTVSSHFVHHFKLSNPLFARSDEELFTHIHHASIPNSFYNIKDTSFTLAETISGSTSSRSINIPGANYTSKTLGETLTTVLSAGTPEYTVTISRTTGKMTIRSTTSSLTAATISFNDSSPKIALGFSSDTIPFSVAGANKSLVSENVCDLTGGIHSIHIHTNLASNSILSSGGTTTSVLGIVPITSENYGVIQFNMDHQFMVKLNRSFVTGLDIQLKDARNNVLDLNGCPFEITLKFVMKPKKEGAALTRLLQINREMLDIQMQRQLQMQEQQSALDEEQAREAEMAKLALIQEFG